VTHPIKPHDAGVQVIFGIGFNWVVKDSVSLGIVSGTQTHSVFGGPRA